jgi:hypothetical protein
MERGNFSARRVLRLAFARLLPHRLGDDANRIPDNRSIQHVESRRTQPFLARVNQNIIGPGATRGRSMWAATPAFP